MQQQHAHTTRATDRQITRMIQPAKESSVSTSTSEMLRKSGRSQSPFGGVVKVAETLWIVRLRGKRTPWREKAAVMRSSLVKAEPTLTRHEGDFSE